MAVGPFILPLDAPDDLILSGAIEDDAPSHFIRALRLRPGAKRLLLSSDGGKVDPALLVATEVRARGLETRIPVGSGCYTAHAFATSGLLVSGSNSSFRQDVEDLRPGAEVVSRVPEVAPKPAPPIRCLSKFQAAGYRLISHRSSGAGYQHELDVDALIGEVGDVEVD